MSFARWGSRKVHAVLIGGTDAWCGCVTSGPAMPWDRVPQAYACKRCLAMEQRWRALNDSARLKGVGRA